MLRVSAEIRQKVSINHRLQLKRYWICIFCHIFATKWQKSCASASPASTTSNSGLHDLVLITWWIQNKIQSTVSISCIVCELWLVNITVYITVSKHQKFPTRCLLKVVPDVQSCYLIKERKNGFCAKSLQNSSGTPFAVCNHFIHWKHFPNPTVMGANAKSQWWASNNKLDIFFSQHRLSLWNWLLHCTNSMWFKNWDLVKIYWKIKLHQGILPGLKFWDLKTFKTPHAQMWDGKQRLRLLDNELTQQTKKWGLKTKTSLETYTAAV